MKTINNADYKLSSINDTYIYTNKSNIDQILNLYNIEELATTLILENKIVPALIVDSSNNIIDLAIIKDGRYRLDATINSVVISIYFTRSFGIRDLIIKKLITSLCSDCNCKGDCDECNEINGKNCLQNQTLFTLVQHYLYINKELNLSAFEIVTNETFDFYKDYFNLNYLSLNKSINIQSLNNIFTRETNIDIDLFNTYLAIYYIGWYREALDSIDTNIVTDLAYLNKVYEYDKLSKCIKKLGLPIEDLINTVIVVPIKVYYWQTLVDEDSTDVFDSFSRGDLVAYPYRPLEDFLEGYTISFNSIGKVVIAISEITNQDFIIKDSLGNDITDEFITYYDAPSKTILFVSQLTYSSTNLYFKFNQL